ncbi:cell filamentation protein Fic [Chimaeribacter californicus]|uniref:Cell filamentation protein Fic n=1 Tax=Chimaeribacter californicus TaxID=2060067 RepID=A0A2N5E8K4_9GAMM|nr:Fic family protein [Chimaeribacter californicus]PLR37980.1 cell filamentation protein Fic [Chimaeribacter californicus]
MNHRQVSRYVPPFTLTPDILDRVAAISELLGRWSISPHDIFTPQLRRGNQIRTIQASLAIENNTLSLEQVTAVLEGKRVLGLPHEIQEVRNAFAAYARMAQWQPYSVAHLLQAHGMLMHGLVDHAGHFRQGGVGIYRDKKLIHMPPPADRVPLLIRDLLAWCRATTVHPIIISCVFHYEFEFIHPFADGNGRMGRLWQSRLLSEWQPMFAFLPVESVINARQEEYYRALSDADRHAEATPFIAFMLAALLEAMQEIHAVIEPVVHVSEAIAALLAALYRSPPLKSAELMPLTGLRHRPTFRKNVLEPALSAGWVAMSHPDSPRSPQQRYHLTAAGERLLSTLPA